MRRAYSRIQYWLRPHAAFFLGDLFDGGRVHGDDEYAYNHIYPLRE